MLRVPATLGVIVALLSSAPVAQKPEASAGGALPVELDAVVVDGRGQSVQGLRTGDFKILEDGSPVVVTRVIEVSAAGIAGAADRRSVVLLLYNTDSRTQVVAREFANRARPADNLVVVRMTHRDDEPAGDTREALRRIAEPQSLYIVDGRSAAQDSLNRIEKIARTLELVEHRHHVLVCVGSRNLCDVYIAPPKRESLLWPHWARTITASARAHLSVHYVDPGGTTQLTGPDLRDGLVEHTGGDVFFNSNNYRLVADRVWNEAGHYYLLEYLPGDQSGGLHTVDVSVGRAGLQVRTRHSRGD